MSGLKKTTLALIEAASAALEVDNFEKAVESLIDAQAKVKRLERLAFNANHGIGDNGQIYLGAINLEGLCDSELRVAYRHPALHETVRAFAGLTIEARELRKSGEIGAATRLETKADAIYTRQMPKSCKW